ncbi:MAG TPA: HAD family hydrolase [Candidatus Saccharimonadales bacterium]|nr:HAD family hydrolase [Candidatus Saccharimonadales bacterium]
MYKIPAGVTVLSFDIWQTLFSGNRSYTWPRLQLVFGHVGILDFGREAITAAYLKAEEHLNRKAEATGFDTGMADRIRYVFNELGVTDKEVPDEQTIVELQKESGILRVRPEYLPRLIEDDLLDTFRALRDAGYRLGTLSNTGMGDCNMVKPVLNHYGLDRLLDVQLFSCEDGRAKPNPGIFQRMVKEFGEEPQSVLHIGDNGNADYRGAIDAGLHAALYAPKGSRRTHIKSMKELLG